MRYIPAIFLGAVYVALSAYVAGYAATWGGWNAWIAFWGPNEVAALTWLQLFHALGTALAALPVAALIVWRYRSDCLRLALLVAMVASALMLFEQLRIASLLHEIETAKKTLPMVSGAIDVLKIGPIFLGVTVLIRRVVTLPAVSRKIS